MTRQELHEAIRRAFDSGEWSADEVHQEVDQVWEAFQDDEAAEQEPE